MSSWTLKRVYDYFFGVQSMLKFIRKIRMVMSLGGAIGMMGFCMVVHASSPDLLEQPEGPVLLVISGLITKTNQPNEAHIDLAMLQKLPAYRLTTHTLVTDGVLHFDGVLVRDLLDWVGVSDSASVMMASALNDYAVNIPLKDFYDYDVLLATHMEGEQLSAMNKGPLWIVYPRDQWRKLQDIRYDYRWVWQLNKIQIK